ncbi:MAG: RtcB family protein [Candidatus Pacearchaeota archaeon]|nr:RtcB family protein [Candidatus Pacearchaeota archaeon]
MEKIKKISENIWEIPKEGNMKVSGKIFASDKLIEKIRKDKTLEQVKNVASLPGIVEYSLAMPDAHQGYGMCVGGVAAFDLKTGIVSPGMTGYDINCGVRLLSSDLNKDEFMKKRKEVTHQLKRDVPSGVGMKSDIRLDNKSINEVLEWGVSWAVGKGYGVEEDIKNCEDNGCIEGANADKVSTKARGRGMNQLGSLGAGNHFLEVQEIEEIYDEKTAKVFGLKRGKICVLIHSGSRGLGHQTASDYIKKCEEEYGIKHLPDRELAYAPIDSDLGRDYLSAMRAAANFGFANRHLIMCKTRGVFKKYFNENLKLVYDVAHNIIKFEEFNINGKKKILAVHRKGATRSFGPGRGELPKKYRQTGQPIFIPGSMGTYSYVLCGTEKARAVSFASTAHGAGRVLSRTFAKNNISIEKLKKELNDKDVYVEGGSFAGLIEEAPEAYKDVNEVVKVSHELGIGNLVARLKPLAVIKG